MILAIGNSSIYEFAAFQEVVRALEKKGSGALLFKQDKCLNGEYLVFKIKNGEPKYFVVIDGKEYDVDAFSGIWYMKPHIANELLTFQPTEYRQFIHRQFLDMRQALWTLFCHKKWLNDPWKMFLAENKIYQLKVAAELGFFVPDTIITSDPERVRDFYENNRGETIVKLLANSPMSDKVIYTNHVTPEYLGQIDSLKQSPAIFQSLVPKAYELRITVVGDKIFPVKIYSQEDEETSLDWRRKPKLNDYELKMEQIALPVDIENRVKKFMKVLSLKFGCLDMIVSQSGEYVFLEINPNGQWYFAQLKTGARIAEAIADLLIE